MTRLVFGKPVRTLPVRLVFGGSESVTAPPVTVHAQASLEPPTFVAGIVYDNRVSRLASVTTSAPTQHGHKASAQLRSVGLAAQKAALEHRVEWAVGVSRHFTPRIGVGASAARAVHEVRAMFEEQVRIGAVLAGSVGSGDRVSLLYMSEWETGKAAGVSLAFPEERPGTVWRRVDVAWQHGDDAGANLTHNSGRGALASLPGFRVPWQHGRNPPIGRTDLPIIPPEVVEPFEPTNRLVFQCPPQTGAVHLILGHECRPTDPTHPGTVIILPQRRYYVSNNVQMRRVSDNVLVLADNIAVGTDYGSWTWSFSASVDIRQEGLVEPGTKLNVSINGTSVVLEVEKWSRERDGLSGRSLRIAGRGHAAMLDSAEAQRLFTNTGIRTAAQLANEALTVNGVPIGYTVDWQLSDWTVPTGVFVHQGTPISALLAIVKAAGGYLMSHPSLPILHALPEYPVLPWSWAATPADFLLPADITSRESLDRTYKPLYTGVTVRGEAEGVEVFVKRIGTDGSVEAPMVVDDLITAKIAADQRGSSILAATGGKVDVGLRMPVLPATGIILPGALVQYSDGAGTYKGLVRSVSVEATFPDVWQLIGVETHA